MESAEVSCVNCIYIALGGEEGRLLLLWLRWDIFVYGLEVGVTITRVDLRPYIRPYNVGRVCFYACALFFIYTWRLRGPIPLSISG